MKSCLYFLCATCLSLLALGESETLQASPVMRVAGDVNPPFYINGTHGVGKGTIGFNGNQHFRLLLAFDLITAVEDLDRLEKAEVKVTYAWNKDEASNPSYRVLLAGVDSSMEMKDNLVRHKFSDDHGELGTIRPPLKSGDEFTFDVTELLRKQKLSPVQRYVWFRIEEAPAMKVKSVAGFSNKPEQMTLTLTYKD